MPVSPAVLSAQKKGKAKVTFAQAAAAGAASSPLASTSKAPVTAVAAAVPSAEQDSTMQDNDEDAGEWQTRVGTADDEEDDAVMIDTDSLLPPKTTTAASGKESTSSGDQAQLSFPALSAKEMQGKVETQTRKVSIPPHRMTPLKRDWPKIYSPLVDECGLMVRMNVGKKNIEMRTSKHTPAPSATILQRAVDFVAAYGLGFSAEDAVALLRMEDLFVETFEIKDVKTLSGDHLSRAIGRIAGKDGKTRFTIENTSKTRIVLADQKIHILGTFQSIKIARDAICALILGSPPGKVYNGLRTVAARQRQRF